MNDHKEQAIYLLDAARRDALTVQLLIQTGQAPHESIGFHTQQACEKLIKAVLVINGIVFQRTHDLVTLHALAKNHHINIPADTEKLRALNSYAVQFRYEGCPVEMMQTKDCSSIVHTLLAWASVELA